MSSTKKYSFMVNHQISKIGFWSRPILSPIMLAFPGAMQALKFSNRKSTFPVQVNKYLILSPAEAKKKLSVFIIFLKFEEKRQYFSCSFSMI